MADFETVSLGGEACAICRQETLEELVTCSDCMRNDEASGNSITIHTAMKAHRECFKRDHKIRRQSSLKSPKALHKETTGNVLSLSGPDSPYSSLESSPCASGGSSPLLSRILTERVSEGKENKRSSLTKVRLKWPGLKSKGKSVGSSGSPKIKSASMDTGKSATKSPLQVEPRYFWNPKQDGAAFHVLRKLQERQRNREAQNKDGIPDQMANADVGGGGYDSGRFLSVTQDGSRSFLSLSPYERRRSSILPGASGAVGGLAGSAGFPTDDSVSYNVAGNKRTEADDNWIQNKCPTVTRDRDCAAHTSQTTCDGNNIQVPLIRVRRASSETAIDQVIVDKTLNKQIQKLKRVKGEGTGLQHPKILKEAPDSHYASIDEDNSLKPFGNAEDQNQSGNLHTQPRCLHQWEESDQNDNWPPEGTNPLPVPLPPSEPIPEGVQGKTQQGVQHTHYNNDLQPETCPSVNTVAPGNPISLGQWKPAHKGSVYIGTSVIDKESSGVAHKRSISISAAGDRDGSTSPSDESPFSVCNQEGIDQVNDFGVSVKGNNHSNLELASIVEYNPESIQDSSEITQNLQTPISNSNPESIIEGVAESINIEGNIEKQTHSNPISGHQNERSSISDGWHQSVDSSLLDGCTGLLIDRPEEGQTEQILHTEAPPGEQKENLFAFNQAWNASFCSEREEQGSDPHKTGWVESNGACGNHGNQDAILTHLDASLRSCGTTDTSHVIYPSRSDGQEDVTLCSTRDALDQTATNKHSLSLVRADPEVESYSDVCVNERCGETVVNKSGNLDKSSSVIVISLNGNLPIGNKSTKSFQNSKVNAVKNENIVLEGNKKEILESGGNNEIESDQVRETVLKHNNCCVPAHQIYESDPRTCPHQGQRGSLSGSGASSDVTIDRRSPCLASPTTGGGGGGSYSIPAGPSDPHNTISSRVNQCCSSGDSPSHVTPPGAHHVTHLEVRGDNYPESPSCSAAASADVSSRHRLLTPILPVAQPKSDSPLCRGDNSVREKGQKKYQPSPNDTTVLGGHFLNDNKEDGNKLDFGWKENLEGVRGEAKRSTVVLDEGCVVGQLHQTNPGHVGLTENQFRLPVTQHPVVPDGSEDPLPWKPWQSDQLDKSLQSFQGSFPAPTSTCSACASAGKLRYKANIHPEENSSHQTTKKEGNCNCKSRPELSEVTTKLSSSATIEGDRNLDFNTDKTTLAFEGEGVDRLTEQRQVRSSPRESEKLSCNHFEKSQISNKIAGEDEKYVSQGESGDVNTETKLTSKRHQQQEYPESKDCGGQIFESGTTSPIDIQSWLPFSALNIKQQNCTPPEQTKNQEYLLENSQSYQTYCSHSSETGSNLDHYTNQGQIKKEEIFQTDYQSNACTPSSEDDQSGGITPSSRNDMVNLERAQVFKGSPDSDDCFVNVGHSENYTNLPECEDIVFEPNKDLNSPSCIRPVPAFNARRRHCSEGEGAVKEKVRRYRNQSVTDEDLEKVLGKAAWLLAVADQPDRSLIRSYHEGFNYQNAESIRVPTGLGSVDTGLNLSALANNTDMKGWGFGGQGSRLNVNPGRTSSCSTSPVKASGPKPLNKYAAILASVGCAPTGPATCPLSLLSGPGANRAAQPRKPDNSGTVTWTHHTCCTPSVTTCGAPQTPTSPCEPASPSSTKGIGNKSCSINMKTYSASFNCRASVGQPASSPVHSSPSKSIKHPSSPQLMGLTDERTKGTRLKTCSSSEGCPGKPSRQKENEVAQTPTPKTPTKSSPAKAGAVAQAKTSGAPAKTSPKTGRSQSTRSKKSKSTSKHNSSSSSSKSSSSSSVATIECESISVTIPDRPMCIMTSTWTPDNDIMSPDSLSYDQAMANHNESQFSVTSPLLVRGTTVYDWNPHRTEEYRLDNASVKYEASILHSDSLSSEADEENNKTAEAHYPTSILRQSTYRSDISEDATTTNDEDDADSSGSALSKTSLLSSKRRHRQRPLSLPSNHQLDLKLCYFNPEADELDIDLSQGRSQQRSRADLDLDLSRSSKRHSTGQSGFDNWHSALHPLIHSQSQILQGSDLSRVAKVKILSKTSWCDCSQEFLTTSQNKRHTCPKSPTQDSKGNVTSCCGKLECKGCQRENAGAGVTMETEKEDEDGGKMKIPKAPSDEFLTEAMKFTREKLRHRCGEDLVTLLEQFYKQIQSVSEELVLLLQERHDLHEQVDMRKIAIEQLVRLQNEAAASNDVTSIQMSVILPGHNTTHR